MRKNSNFKKNTIIILISIVSLLAVLAVCIMGFYFVYNDHYYVGTVTDKERINSGSESYYLVFTEDVSGNMVVLMNDDNLIRLKVDSSNTYGKLEIGKTYMFTLIGYRIPVMSMYENILYVEELA